MPTTPKTLGTLRADLQARLGFAATGGAAGVMATNLNNMLWTAQNTLYWLHDWARLRRYEDTTLGVDQYQIAIPSAANADRILGISINKGGQSGSPSWTPHLRKGISPQMYTTQDNNRIPDRWDLLNEYIEFNAKADQIYPVRVWFIKELERFTQDGDFPDLHDGLVFMFALADAKAHYRQPDAQRYTDQRDALILRIKAKARGQVVWDSDPAEEEAALVKPVVV